MDYGLLVALEALLDTGGVAPAAARMHLSPSAMSRILGRLRTMLGDPLLIRSGRGLIPTARAEALRPRIAALLRQAEAVLGPARFDPRRTQRTFTIRASDAFYACFGGELARRVRQEGPDIRLRFVFEGKEDIEDLRTGRIDLDVGVPNRDLDHAEIRRQLLYRDEMVGLVARDHPLADGRITAQLFAEHPHLSISRRGLAEGPIDAALAKRGRRRRVDMVVPTHLAALLIAADSPLVGTVPRRLAETAMARGLPLAWFTLPVPTPPLTMVQSWHVRWETDPAHVWLRKLVAMASRASA